MKNLYAPWREAYTNSQTGQKKGFDSLSKTDCPFCYQFKQNKDEDYFILGRFNHTFITLNLFPYNAGHLLILPIDHEGDLTKLTQEAHIEIMKLIVKSTSILKEELKPDGFNIGINLGKDAGGSIPAHLHFHVLPRWSGDTNFLPTLSETKQISFDLKKIYYSLRSFFSKIKLD